MRDCSRRLLETKLQAARVLAERYWRRGCSPDGDADNEAAGAGNELAHCPPCCHGACNEGIPIRLTRRAFYGAKNKPVRAVRVEVCPRPVHNNASP